jgi:hypothetical protein
MAARRDNNANRNIVFFLGMIVYDLGNYVQIRRPDG